MYKKRHSIRDLIAEWPVRRDLADDIGISVDRIHKWVYSESIPARYHKAILEAAQARGICIYPGELSRLNALPGDAWRKDKKESLRQTSGARSATATGGAAGPR